MNYPFFRWMASRLAFPRAVGSDESDISAVTSHDNVDETLIENEEDDNDDTMVNDVSDDGIAVASIQEEKVLRDKSLSEKISDVTKSAPLDHYDVAAEAKLNSTENYPEGHSNIESRVEDCGNDIEKMEALPEKSSPSNNTKGILKLGNDEQGGSALEDDGLLLAGPEVDAATSAGHSFNDFEELQEESSEVSTSSTFTMVEIDPAGGFGGEESGGSDEKETKVEKRVTEQIADSHSSGEACIGKLEATSTKNELLRDVADSEGNPCTSPDVETAHNFPPLTSSMPESRDTPFEVMQSADGADSTMTSCRGTGYEFQANEVVTSNDKDSADEIPSSDAENDDVIKEVRNVINQTMQEICESVTDAVEATEDLEILRIRSDSVRDNSITEADGKQDKALKAGFVENPDTECKAVVFSNAEPKEALLPAAALTENEKKIPGSEAKELGKKDFDSSTSKSLEKGEAADRPRYEQVCLVWMVLSPKQFQCHRQCKVIVLSMSFDPHLLWFDLKL